MQERILKATERQAKALETLVALFAGCIGVGTSACAGAMSFDSYDMRDVFYLRTGEGRRSFGCDLAIEPDDNSD